MSTLIYSPGVSIIIDSALEGPVNVSQDASQGSVSLRENGSHTLSLTLENANRKYDGIFVPNDRVVVQMKRFSWIQIFAGYIDSAPYFSTYPGQVKLTAQCSLKVLKHWPWDRGSSAAQQLLSGYQRDPEAQDGGVSKIITDLLTNVALWPEERIHIGRVPSEWLSKFENIYTRLDDQITTEVDPLIGVNPIIAGKPVGGFPAGALSTGGGTSSLGSLFGGSPLSDSQYELLTIEPVDYDVAMATIRQMESGNNYSAVNKGDGIGDWATGAYQFIDSTWANYKGYSKAMYAPPQVQDEKALALIQTIISQQGNKLLNIPYGWYYPRVFRDPSWLDRIPAASEGNALTLRQYGYKWAKVFVEKYLEMRGGAPSQLGPVAPGGSTVITQSIPNSEILYPIPSGIDALDVDEVGWGGHTNGRIPFSAMSYDKACGYGHPMAVEAYVKLHAAASAAGIDLKGDMYRTAEAQAVTGAMAAPVGRSNHGWGLAIDIRDLVPNPQITRKYPGYSNTQMYSTPEYQWLKANAYKYGYGHPYWGQEGGSKPEAWHWEFFAVYNYKNSGTPTQAGVNPFGEGGAGMGGFPQVTAQTLFSAISAWSGQGVPDIESDILSGYRALMNDEPLLPTIKQFCHISGRSYCAAPNGDFISWFPDYWGEYGLAGVVEIEQIELKDFSVNWSDENLITHQFVEGATLPSVGPAPEGIMNGYRATTTRGVATVEMDKLLPALLNVRDAGQYPWLRDPKALLGRFGARVDRNQNRYIYGPHQEFYFAVQRLTRAWAKQFTARAPLTFMPELYPGMLMAIPSLGVQMYVSGVTHSWNYADGAGFSTDVQTMAISATDQSGFFLFPKGGDPKPSGSATYPWPANGGPGGTSLDGFAGSGPR